MRWQNNGWSKLGDKLDARHKQMSRNRLRTLIGVSNNVPIIVGDVSEPRLTGSNGGWFTKGGDPIRHPSAYAKRGRSNMIYRRSTLKITIPVKEKGRYL